MHNKEDIQTVLNQLIEEPIGEFGRAADLLWVGFGNMEIIPNKYSINKVEPGKLVGDWALHVQCAWRVTHKGEIILSWRDFHYKPDGESNYDWGIGGESRFDVLVFELNRKLEILKPKVKSITVYGAGSFSLILEEEFSIDVFPDSSIKDDYSEHWRLFQPKLDSDHFIVD